MTARQHSSSTESNLSSAIKKAGLQSPAFLISSSSKEESQAIDLISSVKAEMVVVVLQPFYLFT